MGQTDDIMIGFLVLLFPVLLMLFMLVMERLEAPLTRVAVERQMEQFLDEADTAELNAFVREGTDNAVGRFRATLPLRPNNGWRRPAARGRRRRTVDSNLESRIETRTGSPREPHA